MKIVPNTKHDYAYVVLEEGEQEEIRELQESMEPDGSDISSLEGLQIEISENDSVPDDQRSSLEEGKFLR